MAGWPVGGQSSAWSWRAGVQSSSRNATFEARVSGGLWRDLVGAEYPTLDLVDDTGATLIPGEVGSEDIDIGPESIGRTVRFIWGNDYRSYDVPVTRALVWHGLRVGREQLASPVDLEAQAAPGDARGCGLGQ